MKLSSLLLMLFSCLIVPVHAMQESKIDMQEKFVEIEIQLHFYFKSTMEKAKVYVLSELIPELYTQDITHYQELRDKIAELLQREEENLEIVQLKEPKLVSGRNRKQKREESKLRILYVSEIMNKPKKIYPFSR